MRNLLTIFIQKIHSQFTCQMWLLFRSSFRDEFWEKYAFWSIEKIPVKSPCLQPYLKNELFQLFFKDFNQFYFCWDIDFFLVSSFYFPFIEKTLHWIFWKCYSLFLHAVYQCELFFLKEGGREEGNSPTQKDDEYPCTLPPKNK